MGFLEDRTFLNSVDKGRFNKKEMKSKISELESEIQSLKTALSVSQFSSAVSANAQSSSLSSTSSFSGSVRWNEDDVSVGGSILEDLNASSTVDTSTVNIRATHGVREGRWYLGEFVMTEADVYIGLSSLTYDIDESGNFLGNSLATEASNSVGVHPSGGRITQVVPLSTSITNFTPFDEGSVVSLLLDLTTSDSQFIVWVDGSEWGRVGIPYGGVWFPTVTFNNVTGSIVSNFGNTEFIHNPPEGFRGGMDSTPFKLTLSSSGLELTQLFDTTEEGLLSYWGFEDPGNLGTDLLSISPMSVVSTVTHGYDEQVPLNYISLNNSGHLLAGSGSLHDTDSYTISARIRTDNAGTTFRGIVVKHFAFGMYLYNNQLAAYDWTLFRRHDTNVPLNDGEWHHVMVTKAPGNNAASEIFIDGVSVLTFNSSISHHDDALTIGAGNPSGAQLFSGDIADVKIFDRVKTPSEVL